MKNVNGTWLALGAAALAAGVGAAMKGSRGSGSVDPHGDAAAEDRRSRMNFARDYPDHLLPNIHDSGLVPAVHLRGVPKLRSGDLVTIYRSVPAGVSTIRPGDWVALSRRYAAQHGRGVVLSRRVPAGHVLWAGTDMNEWFYTPPAGSKNKEGEPYELDYTVELEVPLVSAAYAIVRVTVPWDGDIEKMPTDADVLAALAGVGPQDPGFEKALYRAAHEDLAEAGYSLVDYLMNNLDPGEAIIEPEFMLEERVVLGGRTVWVLNGEQMRDRRKKR